jgi:hypothetical protein
VTRRVVTRSSIRLQEEGGCEWASYNKGGKNGKEEAHVEPAVLYQPLPEAGSSEPSEHAPSEHGGHTHDVSGDGCGDGGYCGGHWVKRSEKGHRHGEPISGGGRGPGGALACTYVAGGMVLSGVDAWMGVSVGFVCSLAGG